MTKALILSDIHSNIYALEAIWAAEGDSDLIYCAGDLVDYGPYPAEVVAWVRDHEVICVQGNHDRWVVANYRQGKTAEQVPAAERAWVHHNAGRLSAEAIAFLEQLPQARSFALDGLDYGLTHLYQEYEEIVSLHQFSQFARETFAGTEPPRLIIGHTHRQAIRYLSDNRLWLNPGSVSFRRPDDPDKSAHYAVIVDGQLSLRRVVYRLGPLRKAVARVAAEAPLQPSEMASAYRFFGR